MINKYKFGNINGYYIKYEEYRELFELTENFYSLARLLAKHTTPFINALESNNPLFGPNLSKIYDQLVYLLDKFEKLKVKD